MEKEYSQPMSIERSIKKKHREALKDRNPAHPNMPELSLTPTSQSASFVSTTVGSFDSTGSSEEKKERTASFTNNIEKQRLSNESPTSFELLTNSQQPNPELAKHFRSLYINRSQSDPSKMNNQR